MTHPVDGLPSEKDFLPTVAEVKRACEALMAPRRAREARERDAKMRRAEREAFERRRNTPEQDAKISEALRRLLAELGRD